MNKFESFIKDAVKNTEELNAQKPRHTPTPWRIKTTKKGDIEIIDEKYNPIAKMVFYPDNLDRKTSEQIVRAVNAHQTLIDALNMTIATVERLADTESKIHSVKGTYDVVNSALAKAEEK